MARVTTAAERPILKSKVFLYITEFFSGMAVMSAEIGASRLLAPYFSSSQIVWTIIIGTIMIALALGALFGGKWADQDPNPDKLYMRIMIAAVWIAMIPLVGKYLILLISGLLVITISTNFLSIAAFVSCMVIFVPPLFLLGTVSAGLNKFATDSLDNNASVVGRLSACNTVGSILGTFLPTFVTIPAVGTFVSFLIFAGILLLIPIVYFIVGKVHRVACAVCAALFVATSIVSPMSGFAFWENDNVYEGESVYNYLQVKDLSDRTILSTNVLFGVQSVTMKDEGLTGMYYDTALAAPAMAENQDSALILGMGTGTYARQLRQYYPNMNVTGVEIDGKITQLAGEYFGEPSDIPVYEYDGRAFMNTIKDTYDVIMVDAYKDITIPFSMSSTEFFNLVRQHLNPGGVMVVNLNMAISGDGSITESLIATIADVFGDASMRIAEVPGTTNSELFAVKGSGAGNADYVRPAFTNLPAKTLEQTGSRELSAYMADVADRLESPSWSQSAIVMTDDQAPVEMLGMRAIDAIIKDEVGPYKQILKEQGPAALLRSLQ